MKGKNVMAAIIKCKMCGGDLTLTPGATVAECEYCGTLQTVPSSDNEKKLVQFERAERLRKNCEFDKAAGVYESIVGEFRQEAEAYWGLVLCKFGIEYVDDPATGKKIPTCHRSSFNSIMDDADFEQTLENADVVSRKVYRDEAKQIEEIRKGIIEVSSKEEPYDIFICYKETDEKGERTVDSVLAQDLYTTLTEKGYRVFFSRITLEDKLGQEYEPYIFAALNSAKIMLAVGTDYEYYNAVWVKNEWSRFLKLIAAGQKKTLIPCYKNIDAYDMPKEFAKLQAQDMGKVGAMQDLLRGIEKILEEKKATPEKSTVQSSDLNKSFVYNNALQKGSSKKIKNVKAAVKELESIAGWQDADSQRQTLELKLKKLKRNRMIKRIVILVIIGALAGTGAMFIDNQRKQNAYNRGNNNLNNAKTYFEDEMEVFYVEAANMTMSGEEIDRELFIGSCFSQLDRAIEYYEEAGNYEDAAEKCEEARSLKEQYLEEIDKVISSLPTNTMTVEELEELSENYSGLYLLKGAEENEIVEKGFYFKFSAPADGAVELSALGEGYGVVVVYDEATKTFTLSTMYEEDDMEIIIEILDQNTVDVTFSDSIEARYMEQSGGETLSGIYIKQE